MHRVSLPSVVVTLALLALVSGALAASAANQPTLGDQVIYLPSVSIAPPTPTVAPTCPAIPGVSYSSLPIVGPPTSLPAASNPDLNLDLRGWQRTSADLGLVTYNGNPDPLAPQLASLFPDNRVPAFSSAYQVYDWNWSTMSRGSLLTTWPVTLLGMAVSPGEIIQAPTSGYTIGQGYGMLVLYATTSQITLTYTGSDSVAFGYAIHLENVCVEPTLLALYQSLNNAGRGHLPALRNGQALGRANGGEIQVAIRDSGSFMDPRSRNDWWQGR